MQFKRSKYSRGCDLCGREYDPKYYPVMGIMERMGVPKNYWKTITNIYSAIGYASAIFMMYYCLIYPICVGDGVINAIGIYISGSIFSFIVIISAFLRDNC